MVRHTNCSACFTDNNCMSSCAIPFLVCLSRNHIPSYRRNPTLPNTFTDNSPFLQKCERLVTETSFPIFLQDYSDLPENRHLSWEENLSQNCKDSNSHWKPQPSWMEYHPGVKEKDSQIQYVDPKPKVRFHSQAGVS